MQTPLALYIATLLGAIALVLIMPKQRWNARLLGGLLGAASLGGLWLAVAPQAISGMAWSIFAYYYVFSAIAIVAAVRVITHTRPVYAALWFVMVVLASAGLFLILSAEFMAFAMVIIYAGAILVTYMFVIMLATQAQSDDESEVSPTYDRVAKEPVGAVVAGFLLLAVLLSVSFEPMEPTPGARGPADATLAGTVLAGPSQLRTDLPVDAAAAELTGQVESETLTNAERVGLDLFRAHPLGLELAGVILLVSLIGAVVIAKTRVPEEEEPVSAVLTSNDALGRPRIEPGPKDREAAGQSGGRVGV